ncbi:MAG: restriction endonuclease subunit S [Atopobiaceae bacterium]|nr:restriction endonuclease subunit S [Atopobiaceae bacterium]
MERYEAYKDSGIEWIGEIPQHWLISKGVRALSVRYGYPFESNRFSNTKGWPLIRIRDVGSKTTESLYDGEFVESARIENGDILVGMDGEYKVARWEGHTALLNQRVCALENSAVLLKDYLLYLMPEALRLINELTYGTTVKHLGAKDLNAMSLICPPIDEQRAIADYLDAKTAEVDALVADCEREVGLLREYRKAAISEAVTKGLDPDAPMKDSGVEWIGEIPASWDIVRFKAIGTVVANLQHPTDYPDLPQVSPDRIEKDSGRLLPCISVAEVGVESDNHLFHIGDILYSKVRPALNKVTIAPFDGMCSADMYPIESSQNRRWLVFYMLSNAFMEQVVVSTDRVKMPKVNKEELGAFKVVLPSLDAQSEIVAYLDAKTAEIDSLIEEKQEMADKLREYRKSLISEAVTDKFKVPGA